MTPESYPVSTLAPDPDQPLLNLVPDDHNRSPHGEQLPGWCPYGHHIHRSYDEFKRCRDDQPCA